MNELLENIKSRGHWKVIIRPTTFIKKRVADRSALRSILEKNSVESKGWSFPHVSSHGPLEMGDDWIGQELSFDYIKEFWRFYQSGQFVHYFGMPEDWGYESNQRLSREKGYHQLIMDSLEVVTQCTEILEFAARLSLTEAGDSEIILEITVSNMEDHFLQLPGGGPETIRRIPEAREPQMEYRCALPRHELVAETKELALPPALKVFECFHWNPGVGVLRDLQDKWLEKRPIKIGRHG